jgi:hypothetical protein
MPKGPLQLPRLTNLGPLSRSTKEEIKSEWGKCPTSGTPKEICSSIKTSSIAILESQGFFAECDDLVDINSGNCVRVAERVHEEVDDTDIYVAGDWDHVWVEYNGKHYDAEVPTGVNDPLDLPFFARIPREDLLVNQRMAAKVEGREPPESIDDVIREATDEFESKR